MAYTTMFTFTTDSLVNELFIRHLMLLLLSIVTILINRSAYFYKKPSSWPSYESSLFLDIF